MPATATVRLHPADLARVASVGLRTRRVRATLSALGIAIGVAAMVAVLGLSASSQAGLLSEIDELGTNLLTVEPGQTMSGETAKLPEDAVPMISRIGPVENVQSTGEVAAKVYRTRYIPEVNTNGLSVHAASLGLPTAVSTSVAQGEYLNAATAAQPVAVLGADAARRLGVYHLIPNQRIWVGEQWFYVAGILNPAKLTPEIDTSVLIGYESAAHYLNFDGYSTKVYVLSQPDQVTSVYNVLAATANPATPDEITVSRPSTALIARAAAQSAFNGLFLGLGAVALLVGGIGVANTMVISVLERRSEIGLRRALGATRGDIRTQFLSEAILLAAIGGAVGVGAGVLATVAYAQVKGWETVVPPLAWAGGLGASMLIGAVAGLLPALRAARMAPTEALRTA
ncbi:ABC transporter permease [Actinoplanes lobatus]|uniref:ABC transporter permease n=1 Tax=Actinoplanes lobatus TaxID=113568 RepID=A0A7W7HKM1_9ACTN|nr:ABC transporter permease [Actinoplanes lobatus]MBB4752278.1 putative ABC transport system permease protein [Actinoplanes lobatus]GGN94150.1 ABC transporter permease [Actinoplanes lobatus]GIE45737.1 ABC transporter permease [Actinoplanes lobatus]